MIVHEEKYWKMLNILKTFKVVLNTYMCKHYLHEMLEIASYSLINIYKIFLAYKGTILCKPSDL